VVAAKTIAQSMPIHEEDGDIVREAVFFNFLAGPVIDSALALVAHRSGLVLEPLHSLFEQGQHGRFRSGQLS
jgi:hypothetical protein